MLPVALALEGVPCLVVGDGPLAEGRVSTLLDACAEVAVVAATPCAGLRAKLARGSAVHLDRPFRPGDSAGRRVVFAATRDDPLNRRVAADARAHGALVNVADTPALCDFYMPAVHRAGPVTVAVSSAGTSPALAAWLRTRLAAQVGPEVGDLALVLASCRDSLRSRGSSLEDAEWASLIDEAMLTAVRAGDDDAVAARVRTWMAAQP